MMSPPDARGAAATGGLVALLLTALIALPGCGAGVTATDREDFGRAGDAVWSPLSGFERRAIGRRAEAARGDYDALLGIGLVGSGEPREEAELAELRGRLWAFVRRHRDPLTRTGDHAARGKRLLQLMHAELLGASGSDALGSYRAPQSRLAGALQDGTYNCISSAMLYIVLARAVGLQVRGVHLPHHAFVELVLPDGRRLDVETTNPAGFGLRRDAAWFASRGGAWARDRGLAATSWEQYRRRRIVSPLRLFADNMINQHSGAERIGVVASHRLRELRALLLPDDAAAQLGRLNVYGREHNALVRAGEHATIVRMFAAVEPALATVQARFSGRVEIRNTLAWHRSHYAAALQRTGNYELAVAWVRVALQLAAGIPDRAKIEHNATGVVWRQAEELGRKGDFPAGQAVMRPFSALCSRQPWCAQNRYWLYAQWTSEAFERKDWRAAIERGVTAIPYAPDAARRQNARNNVEAAWLNLIATTANAGDRPRARGLAAQCVQRHPWASRCRAMVGRL